MVVAYVSRYNGSSCVSFCDRLFLIVEFVLAIRSSLLRQRAE